jgi:tRNA pseudouridine55 synthase
MISNNSDEPLFGFINVYKPKGITSHDVVSRLRKITKIKQIGHTGTLDPFAVGVLPICIGKATRLIEYLEDDKEYIATIQFGKNTDSYDIDGNVTEIFEKKITKEDLLTTLKNFEGDISQIPPIYSAIKVNGKKLYDYARSGQEVEIKPRKVFLSKIELLNFDYETQTAKINVGCSKGTYIRSIAYDIGKNLGCGGYLSALERTKAGNFYIDNSIKLEEITDKEIVNQNIINPLDVIDFPKYNLSEEEVKKVSHGMNISNNDFNDEDIVFLIYSGKIYAIGMVNKNKILVKKVFEVL